MSTDAIVLLREDHQDVKRLFTEFENAGGDAYATKAKLAEQIIAMLTTHTYLENECVYPVVRELVPGIEDDILESYEEHHVADVLCMELDAMSPEDERFAAKMMVLAENVRHHIKEEEDVWFPKVRDALGRKQLQEIGQRMLEMRPTAPRRPSQPSALKKAVDAILS
ncbi:hemerythrin domain-containing protein [Sporichthya sp.]|uniref:hemerythrin domain-containing protein n=1 Tax=Sporichthya sp. TaxID=65475 RepID=UPI00179E5D0A|nr:hemerythrin domain-containing protein [Sporichthya sp.]MBA3741854.1 hemerythrin domain-containing protein [Sporichthya sp.]